MTTLMMMDGFKENGSAKKVLRFIAIALFISLIVGVTIVIVGATDSNDDISSPSLEIISNNLSYSDSNYILYAIANEGFDRTKYEIKMLFWDKPQESYLLGTESYSKTDEGVKTVKGESCLIFYSNGIAAKEMTDDIYARACVAIDEKEYYSPVLKYSVLEYVYSAREQGTLSETRLALFTAMLEYGAAAQKNFNYNLDRLANADYYFVEVVNGSLDDGTSKALCHTGEVATLTANPAPDGYKFAYWQNSAGEVVSTANSFVLDTFTADETYTAIYEEEAKYSEGLVFTSNGDGTCYVSGIGTCTDTDIIIPPVSPDKEEVTAIGNRAFSSRNNLTSVTIPDSVITIGQDAFAWCEGITSIIMPDSVTTLGYRAFSGCTRLTSITIPNSVTTIVDSAFSNCTGLENVTIGNSVKTIGDSAFRNCTGLTSVTIGNKVETIGHHAFYCCTRLTDVYYLGTEEDWANISIGSSNAPLTNATKHFDYTI